jgi:hypothetical protein
LIVGRFLNLLNNHPGFDQSVKNIAEKMLKFDDVIAAAVGLADALGVGPGNAIALTVPIFTIDKLCSRIGEVDPVKSSNPK